MKKIKTPLTMSLFALSLLILSGCQGIDLSQMSDEDLERISEKAVVCNEPYIRVGIECCLDKDNNGICDRDEVEEGKKQLPTNNENSLTTETVSSIRPQGFVNPTNKNSISGNAVLNKPEEIGNIESIEEKENEEQEATTSQNTTGAPQFKFTIQDVTEGLFNAEGKLQITGQILAINGPTFYNDFELTIQNLENEKILCKVDRKIDIDTDFDGNLDIEGILSLNRLILKIKEAAKETIKAGIESVPGNVQNYQGKGEILTEYTTRCYPCLDERCDNYDTTEEEQKKALFRVKINEQP